MEYLEGIVLLYFEYPLILIRDRVHGADTRVKLSCGANHTIFSVPHQSGLLWFCQYRALFPDTHFFIVGMRTYHFRSLHHYLPHSAITSTSELPGRKYESVHSFI